MYVFGFFSQELTLSGQAQLALHRRNIDTFAQTVTIHKTVGDKSGLFHIGPQQTLFADFQQDSPLLQFGTFIYSAGVLKAQGVLTVNAITIELEGTLDDIEELVIGPMGNVILRYLPFYLFIFCSCIIWTASSEKVPSSMRKIFQIILRKRKISSEPLLAIYTCSSIR